MVVGGSKVKVALGIDEIKERGKVSFLINPRPATTSKPGKKELLGNFWVPFLHTDEAKLVACTDAISFTREIGKGNCRRRVLSLEKRE